MTKAVNFNSGAAVAALTMLTGCMPMPMYPPQQPPVQLSAEEQRQFLSRLLGGTQVQAIQPTQQPSQPQAPTAVTAEADLGQQIAALPKISKGVLFERRRDGFDVDGIRFIDPEGRIVKYGFDNLTGDVTYLARTNPTTFVIKFVRVTTSTEPITLANATKSDGYWHVETVTGKKLNGQSLLMGGKGFIVARDNSGFMYLPGQGIRNIGAPDDFEIAAFQHGDITGTGFILLERRKKAQDAQNPVGNFIKSLNNVAATVGLSRQEDYVLYNALTGRQYAMNITSTGKERQIFSDCHQIRRYLEKCDNVEFVESLYNTDGSPLLSHYFWRIAWYNSSAPILIAQENGLVDITVTNLETGAKATAFSRTLGIAGFTTGMNREGKVSISAQLGFSKERIADAAALVAAKAESQQ